MMTILFIAIWLLIGFISAVQVITRGMREDVFDDVNDELHPLILIIGTLLGLITPLFAVLIILGIRTKFFKAR